MEQNRYQIVKQFIDNAVSKGLTFHEIKKAYTEVYEKNMSAIVADAYLKKIMGGHNE